jgi:hypothetical protein
MSCAGPAPLLLSVLLGLLLGLIGWGLLGAWRSGARDAFVETQDDLLMGLLALSAFAAGVFVTYLVIGLG